MLFKLQRMKNNSMDCIIYINNTPDIHIYLIQVINSWGYRATNHNEKVVIYNTLD